MILTKGMLFFSSHSFMVGSVIFKGRGRKIPGLHGGIQAQSKFLFLMCSSRQNKVEKLGPQPERGFKALKQILHMEEFQDWQKVACQKPPYETSPERGLEDTEITYSCKQRRGKYSQEQAGMGLKLKSLYFNPEETSIIVSSRTCPTVDPRRGES